MNRLLVLLCLTPAASWSGTIYDNGLPNQFDALEMTSFLQAQDFTLAVNATFDGIRFWTLEDLTSYSGSIYWAIYSDNGGVPDSILFSSTGVPVRTPTGLPGLSLDEFEYTLAIPSTNLGPGTYWLALHNGPLSNNGGAQMLWETTDSNASAYTGQEIPLPGTDWGPNFVEHAFQLTNTDIPEPGTMLLGLSSLAALAAARRLNKISRQY